MRLEYRVTVITVAKADDGKRDIFIPCGYETEPVLVLGDVNAEEDTRRVPIPAVLSWPVCVTEDDLGVKDGLAKDSLCGYDPGLGVALDAQVWGNAAVGG